MTMSPTPRTTPKTVRRIAAACGTGVLLVGVTACGSGNAPAATSGQSQAGAEGGPGTTRDGGAFPGADGKVAAVDGSTAQVQSRTNGQVAVTWNSATTFTKQVDASLDDIAVGTCVLVQSADGASSSADPAKVTADVVRITEKVEDGCAGGLGRPGAGPGGFNSGPGGGGERPDFDGQAPEGSEPPTDSSGAPRVRALGGAVGEVTAVSAGGFTVKSTVPRFGENGSTPTTEQISIAVTVTGATTYTTTGAGTAADVTIGACLRAEGRTDSTGAVTATTIAMSPATDGECGGMVFRGGAPVGSGDVITQES